MHLVINERLIVAFQKQNLSSKESSGVNEHHLAPWQGLKGVWWEFFVSILSSFTPGFKQGEGKYKMTSD